MQALCTAGPSSRLPERSCQGVRPRPMATHGECIQVAGPALSVLAWQGSWRQQQAEGTSDSGAHRRQRRPRSDCAMYCSVPAKTDVRIAGTRQRRRNRPQPPGKAALPRARVAPSRPAAEQPAKRAGARLCRAARAVCSQRFCSSGKPAAASGSGSAPRRSAPPSMLPVLSTQPRPPLSATTPTLHSPGPVLRPAPLASQNSARRTGACGRT
jgi:hypothetical protein